MAERVKLIVDSTSDLPPDWLAKWDIPVLAVYVNFGDESFLDDGIALPRAEFYRRLAASRALPTTSAPPPGVAEQLMRKQLDKAEHVVFFTVASAFSSLYNNVRLAAQQVDPKRITVVDSGSASMGLGWMVAAAAEAAQRGADVEEVLAAARDTSERLKLWAAIDTLQYLRRGGRVNALVASVGTLLQIKPIIDVKEGKVGIVQRVRTMNKARQTLIDLAHEQAPLERLAVLHTNFPEGAADLLARLSDLAPANTITVDVTTAIGTHVGPGCLGLSPVRKAKT
jgi:DegV family protein with EDD domain